MLKVPKSSQVTLENIPKAILVSPKQNELVNIRK